MNFPGRLGLGHEASLATGTTPEASRPSFVSRHSGPSASSELISRIRTSLHSSLDSHSLAELNSLAGERDTSVLSEGLYSWAQRQESAGRLEAAMVGYSALLEGSAVSPLRARAQARFNAINGVGSSGLRAEFLLRRLARDASDPVMITGMALGSAVFSTARAGFLSQILSRPGAGFLTRGLGARALAATGAFALEVPAFWATTKGLNELLHPGVQSWDWNSNLREIAGLGITLGALKMTGWGASSLARGRALGGIGRTQGSPLQGLLNQGGMFTGILLGHRLEEAVGLRPPVDGATTFTDSLAMLIQFNVGGRLANGLLGSRFQAFQHEMDMRSRTLAHESAGRGGIGLGGMESFVGANLVFARAAGTIAGGGGRSKGLPLHISRPGILHMSSMTGDGVGGGTIIHDSEPAREIGIRNDIQPTLPRRTGSTPNDRFETTMSPPEIMEAITGQAAYGEITARLEEVRDLGTGDHHLLGAAVGEALKIRLDQIASHSDYPALHALAGKEILEVDFRDVPRLHELSRDFQQALNVTAELMQITQFAIRSNQGDLLHAVRGRLSHRDPAVYQELLSIIRLLKGPRLVLPVDAIARGAEVHDPNLAILSHGTGDMAATLKVPMHLVVPGGRPWYARYFATDAEARIVDSIRFTGRNPNFKKPIAHNYEGDLPIEAVYNRDPLAQILFRTVQVQLLNVPSVVLERLMNEDFIRNLPENAILVSAIGGLLDAGAERPQLPFQFFRERLDRYGRGDVELVTMAGYIPGDKMWRGERVMVNLSAREDLPHRKSHPRPAAETVARMYTGQSGPNFVSDHMVASVSHWERSNNLGKVAKNIFTLLVGYRAAQIAREVVEQQAGLPRDSSRREEIFNLGQGRYLQMRERVWQRMQDLLTLNEGIKRNRATYTPEVEQDFLNCSNIDFNRLVEVVRRGRELSMREATPETLKDFLIKNVTSPNDPVASTRNPRRGIAQVLYEDWIAQGLPYTYDEIGPRDTYEGVNSLELFIRFFNHPSVDIEHQRLPDDVYEMARAFLGRAIEPPPKVRNYLRQALKRRAEDFEAREVQDTLRRGGINPQRIRELLEGRSEAALVTLDREIGRLWIRQVEWRRAMERGRNPEPFEEEFFRQAEVVNAMKEALLRGNPVDIVRSRIAFGPYQNAFVIERRDGAGRTSTHQAFLRLDLEEVAPRLTSLGLFLRSFPPEDNIEIDVRIPDVGSNVASLERLLEVDIAGREITKAFRRHRSGSIRLTIDRKGDEEELPTRGAPTERFYDSLLPLGRWILDRQEGPLTRDEVRQLLRRPRHETADALDSVVRGSTGWVMLLGPATGPLQGGIRAMLTRPEKSVLIGVYSGQELIDSFAVYRYDRNEARVLYHQNLERFSQSFTGHPVYGELNALHYFNGFNLESFIHDYQLYAAGNGVNITRVAPIPIRYAPVEHGLVGNIPGVNAAVLRLFLLREGDPARDQMLREVQGLYEMSPEEGEPRFQSIVRPYLERYLSEHREEVEGSPLYQFFHRFGFLRRRGR